MSKFINSKEAITSSLLLWQDKPTQVSVEDTYDIKVWPTTNIFNDGPIIFVIPPQPNGMLTRLNIVTKFKVNIPGNPDVKKDLSIINNVGNAMWGLVEIKLDDRIDLMQSMRNSYAYQTYFNTCLNTESNHQDYLYASELFQMDEAVDKEDSEDSTMLKITDIGDDDNETDLQTLGFKSMGTFGIRRALKQLREGGDNVNNQK